MRVATLLKGLLLFVIALPAGAQEWAARPRVKPVDTVVDTVDNSPNDPVNSRLDRMLGGCQLHCTL